MILQISFFNIHGCIVTIVIVTSLLLTEVKFSVPSTSVLSCQYLPTNASFSHFIGLHPTPCYIGNWQRGNCLYYALLQRDSTLHMPKIIEGQADNRSCSYNKTKEMHLFLKFIFWNRTLHAADRFSVIHQESSIVYAAIGIYHTGYADCLLASSQHNLYVLLCVQC
jgi:hypothetical protein